MTLDKDSLGGLNGGFSGLDDPPIAGLLRKAVYDAAMAWHEVGTRKLTADPKTSEWWLEYIQQHIDMGAAAKALDAACRRAKEGR